MLKQINKWLEPPVFSGENEVSEQARNLSAIMHYLFGLLVLSAIAVPLVTPIRERGTVFGIILVLLILTGISRLLLFNGLTETSGIILAVSLWVVDIIVATVAGGISSPMMFAAATITIIFGLLLKPPFGQILIGMNILAGLGMILLPSYGVFLPRLFNFSEIAIWFILLLCMIFSGTVITYTFQRLDKALKKSQRTTEETISRNEALFRALFDNVNDGMLFSSSDGFITFRSPAYQRIDGYSIKDWGRLRHFDLIHPEDRMLMQRNWRAVLENPSESVRLEYRLQNKHGSWIWVETVIQNLLSETDIGSIVLTTRDISERKQIEETRRQHNADVLRSVLEERQRLARELHDSIGQVLGYVSFQTEAARELYASGKVEAADAHLLGLAAIAQDAHADLREYILNLRTTPTAREPLFKTIQNYLDGFSRNYNIHTDLALDEKLDEHALDAKAQLSIFRIVQEALSNIRKHAAAQHAIVTLSEQDGLLHMIIEDDGRGFDLKNSLSDGKSHFGLSFMSERVEQLGGSIRFESGQPSGTRVLVEVPVKKEVSV
jgi:PAS domain S-box-containing protein